MVKDPIKEMVKNAVYARYHDEDYAKKALLPRFYNIYYPSPESTLHTCTFTWREGIMNPQSTTYSNPLQLSPSKEYFALFRKTENSEESNKKTFLKGVWNNSMVGPLNGKAYSKEVPIKYETISLNFYSFSPESIFQSFKDEDPRGIMGFKKYTMDFPQMWSTFKQMSKSHNSYQVNAVLTACVKDALQQADLKNITWYTTHFNFRSPRQLPQPINYNPLSLNLDSYFSSFEWGEMFFEDPPDRLEKEDLTLYEGIMTAKQDMLLAVQDWVSDKVGEHFNWIKDEYDEDGGGWSFDSDWSLHMGMWLLENWKAGSSFVHNFIDATLGFQFSHLESWQQDYLLANRNQLDLFCSFPTLIQMMALQLPQDDYMEEWITEFIDD